MTKAQKKKIRDKKNKLLKELAEKFATGVAFTTAETTEIAEKWMEIADTDGSGTVDAAEFVDFVQKLDEANYNEDATKAIFAGADADGDGQLSVEEFGSAIHESLKSMKVEEVQGEEDNE